VMLYDPSQASFLVRAPVYQSDAIERGMILSPTVFLYRSNIKVREVDSVDQLLWRGVSSPPKQLVIGLKVVSCWLVYNQ
jgi:hypothetical protein